MVDIPRLSASKNCIAVTTWGQELSRRSKMPIVTSPRHFRLMAALNSSRIEQYDAASIVVPFSMKSTNSTPLQSQKTIAITLPADLPTLNFFNHRDPGCHHSMLTRFVSSDNAFREIITMNGTLLEE